MNQFIEMVKKDAVVDTYSVDLETVKKWKTFLVDHLKSRATLFSYACLVGF